VSKNGPKALFPKGNSQTPLLNRLFQTALPKSSTALFPKGNSQTWLLKGS